MRTRHQRRKPSAKLRDGAEDKKKVVHKRPNAYGKDAFEFNVDSINFKAANKRASSGASSIQAKKKKPSSGQGKTKPQSSQTVTKVGSGKSKDVASKTNQQKFFYVQCPAKPSVSRVQGTATSNTSVKIVSHEGTIKTTCVQTVASASAGTHSNTFVSSQRLRKQKTISGCPCCTAKTSLTHSQLPSKNDLVYHKETKVKTSVSASQQLLKKSSATSTHTSPFSRMSLLPQKRPNSGSKGSDYSCLDFRPSSKKAKLESESDSDCIIIKVKGPVSTDREVQQTMKKKKICKPPVVNIDNELNREVSHPSEIITQEQFLSIYGLVSKSVLETNRSATPENPCKLHRSPGGKLRRLKTHKFISKFTSRKLHLDPAKVVSPLAVLNKSRGHLGHMSKDILRLYDAHCGNKMPLVKLNKVLPGLTDSQIQPSSSSSLKLFTSSKQDIIARCDNKHAISTDKVRAGVSGTCVYPQYSISDTHEARERKTPPLECDETLSDTDSPGEKTGIKQAGYSLFRISDNVVTCIQGEVHAESEETQELRSPERVDELSLTCNEEMMKESDESYGQDDTNSQETSDTSCINEASILNELQPLKDINPVEEGAASDKAEQSHLVDFENLLHALAPENSLIRQFSDLRKDDKQACNVDDYKKISEDVSDINTKMNVVFYMGKCDTDCEAKSPETTAPESFKQNFDGSHSSTHSDFDENQVKREANSQNVTDKCSLNVKVEEPCLLSKKDDGSLPLERNQLLLMKDGARPTTSDQSKDLIAAEDAPLVELGSCNDNAISKKVGAINGDGVSSDTGSISQVIFPSDSEISKDETAIMTSPNCEDTAEFECQKIKTHCAVQDTMCHFDGFKTLENSVHDPKATSENSDEENLASLPQPSGLSIEEAVLEPEEITGSKCYVESSLVKVARSEDGDYSSIIDTAEKLKQEISENAVMALKEALIESIVEQGLSEDLIPIVDSEEVVVGASGFSTQNSEDQGTTASECIDMESASFDEKKHNIVEEDTSVGDPIKQVDNKESSPSGSMPLLTTLLTSTMETDSKLTTITDTLVEKLCAMTDETTMDYATLKNLYNILPNETLDLDLPVEYENEISTRSRPVTPEHDMVPTYFPPAGERRERETSPIIEEGLPAPEVYGERVEVEPGSSTADQHCPSSTTSAIASKSPAMMKMMKVIFRPMRNPWICGQTSLDVNDVNMPRACRIPHICDVCWVNDHAYCRNMKRGSAALGSCLHNFKPCEHFTYDTLKKTMDVIEIKGLAPRQLPNILRRKKKDK
ncbi:uncharacterized protein LOC106171254 [Lingula anatina]|uniref:Uncharacterized protein LOC106171254 n=1 Tax=Lingula anatina TaxID=7574 RepID=A0A1S3J9A2_LINAN|nr:uncharacterized protein LOC106171254 [Lingula anatina]|eukprot:XP_013406980.1 uncharacterized protein LOC106171254 [Lingula anatina]